MAIPTAMMDPMSWLLNAKTAQPATFSSVRLTEKRFALEMDANVMALRAAPLTSLLVWMGQRVFQRVICVMVTHTVMMAKMMLICMNYYLNGDEILVLYLLYLHPSFNRCTTIMYIYVYFLDFGVKCSMTSD